MNSFFCTHCGKKNFMELTAVAPTPEPEPVPPVHNHLWFLTTQMTNPREDIYDCECGARKRERHEPDGLRIVDDESVYPIGSNNRALYVR